MNRREVLSLIIGSSGVGAIGALAAGINNSQIPRSSVGSVKQTKQASNTSNWNDEKLEMALHSQINAIRRERGLSELTWNAQLAPLTRSHAETMARSGFVSHTSFNGRTVKDRYKAAGVNCEPSENLFQANWTVLWNQATTTQQPVYVAIARVVLKLLLNDDMSRQRILSSDVESAATGASLSEDNTVFIVQNLC